MHFVIPFIKEMVNIRTLANLTPHVGGSQEKKFLCRGKVPWESWCEGQHIVSQRTNFHQKREQFVILSPAKLKCRISNKEPCCCYHSRLSSGRGGRRPRLPRRPRSAQRPRQEALEGLHPAEPQVLPRARMPAALGARVAERHGRTGALLRSQVLHTSVFYKQCCHMIGRSCVRMTALKTVRVSMNGHIPVNLDPTLKSSKWTSDSVCFTRKKKYNSAAT